MVALKSTSSHRPIPTQLHQPSLHYPSEGLMGSADLRNDVEQLIFNFKSSDKSLPDSKKLDTDIWYEEDTYLWVKAAFDKTGYWEYRIKKVN